MKQCPSSPPVVPVVAASVQHAEQHGRGGKLAMVRQFQSRINNTRFARSPKGTIKQGTPSLPPLPWDKKEP